MSHQSDIFVTTAAAARNFHQKESIPAASQRGFTYFGYLAENYEQLFGETPRTTVKLFGTHRIISNGVMQKFRKSSSGERDFTAGML
jgi:hypothetical protein